MQLQEYSYGQEIELVGERQTEHVVSMQYQVEDKEARLLLIQRNDATGNDQLTFLGQEDELYALEDQTKYNEALDQLNLHPDLVQAQLFEEDCKKFYASRIRGLDGKPRFPDFIFKNALEQLDAS